MAKGTMLKEFIRILYLWKIFTSSTSTSETRFRDRLLDPEEDPFVLGKSLSRDGEFFLKHFTE